MTGIDFHLLGRATLTENPELFHSLANKIQQLQNRALTDIEQLPALYNTFCAITGTHPEKGKEGRQTVETVMQRRLFIAVAVYLYDPMFFNSYTHRMRDRLRDYMAESMQCIPEWISNVIPSIRFEYKHLSTFQMQVNLLSYYIRQQAERQAA